jgi:hypothetical protein
MFYTSTRTVASHALDSQVEDLPLGLDPTTTPIIATHFFGWRPPVEPSVEVTDLDLFRLAGALHRLGKALGVNVGHPADVLRKLEVRLLRGNYRANSTFAIGTAGATSGLQPDLNCKFPIQTDGPGTMPHRNP